MTNYEQAHAIVVGTSKPLATIIDALGQENRLNRLERASKLSAETKLFFQKVSWKLSQNSSRYKPFPNHYTF